MKTKTAIAPVRILPEEIANKIAAGEVVERPASVVKELVENALDAHATRIVVRLVAAGRRTIEVIDNGHGMSEQDALLSVERHATSKVRKADDLDNILTLGFRGEALASIAAVSRFELLTRREDSSSATRVRIEGGILRDTGHAAGPVGTKVAVNRLYFNTPARAKFLKGITTELSHCIDIAQRHALSHEGVGFHLIHNDKTILEIPEGASLRERVALIWGLNTAKDLVDIETSTDGMVLRGLIGAPGLSRAQRSHQYFFLNQRPVVNRSLQYGAEEAYQGLLTIGRHPVYVLLLSINPHSVDVNIHPSKREVRFRDERVTRDTVRELIRARLASLDSVSQPVRISVEQPESANEGERGESLGSDTFEGGQPATVETEERQASTSNRNVQDISAMVSQALEDAGITQFARRVEAGQSPPVQTDFVGDSDLRASGAVAPEAMYRPVQDGQRLVSGQLDNAFQVFDAYLIVQEQDRLLIIDQHALHERLTYDSLLAELREQDYEAQQLAVPVLVDVPPSHKQLLESNVALFARMGIEIEPFGGNTFQITSICHLYEESKVSDAVYRVLDALAQGDLFTREDFIADLLRLTVTACRASVKAGDRLAPEERRGLLDGFRRLRPPYTCPHGRPIITELTLQQMEKSFRRRQ